jgi:hypothetical protein
MKCPECGATLKKISPKCSECGAQLKKNSGPLATPKSRQVEATVPVTVKSPEPRKHAPSLIEFPGINRNALPDWRKELSERVREKQERRAREAVLEAGGAATVTVDDTPANAPMLELLPQTELPPVNPIVQAALKRIERAHSESPSFSGSRAALATAVAYDEPRAFAQVNAVAGLPDASANSDSESAVESKP